MNDNPQDTIMTIQEFRDYMASGKPVIGGGDVHMMFHQLRAHPHRQECLDRSQCNGPCGGDSWRWGSRGCRCSSDKRR